MYISPSVPFVWVLKDRFRSIVVGNRELPHVAVRAILGTLGEQQVLITTEPSLQYHFWIFETVVCVSQCSIAVKKHHDHSNS